MKNYDSDLYLYAKNHYVSSGNTVQDLNHILGKRSGINPNHIRICDIISVLTKLAWEHIKGDTDLCGHMFFEFVSDISPENWWRCRARHDNEHPYEYHLAVIGKCLSILCMAKVRDGDTTLIELDEKDEELQKRILG